MKRWLLCLALFHAPDGSPLTINTSHITAIRPAEQVKHHVAAGVNTILYVSGQNFGVKETPDQVEEIIENCQEN